MTMAAQAFDTEERKRYIGASEIAAIMGRDSYRTALDVFNEKTGRVASFGGNNHTDRGNRLEPIAAELYTELTGHKLRRRNAAFIHPEYSFIQGHIDRAVNCEDRLVEIKCPSVAAYRRFQREGLPESYIIQAQVYMGLARCEALTYAIFCADVWDMATFDIQFDAAIYNAAIDAAVDFWMDHVVLDVPPIETTDKQTIEFEKIGGDLIVSDTDEARMWAAKFKEAAEIKADAETLYESLKTDGIALIADKPGRYELGGVRFTYSESVRTTFDKKGLMAAHPEIDYEPFNKQSKPFKTFRPYLQRGGK